MLGTVVVAGMLAATSLAIFLIPALFVLVEKLAARGQAEGSRQGRRPGASPAPIRPAEGTEMRKLAASSLVALALLTGCAVGPDYKNRR